MHGMRAVSYTHLDVYKRQILYRMESVLKWIENQENKDNTANEDQVKIRKID